MPNSAPQNWKASVEICVPFHDIDPMEIVWHGHYVKYFEIARSALLDQLDYNFLQMRDSGYGWPVVDMRLKYVRPAIFNKKINVSVEIVEWELSFKLKYLITDIETGKVLTRGHTVQVALDMQTGEMCFATPEVFRKKLGIDA